jgi:adenine deaminase
VIVGVGEGYEGKEEVDIEGRTVAPGLIDGHMHIESTMLIPSRLAAALLVRGTTAIVSDPHEIANVMGLEGIRFMLRESESLAFDIFFMAPSCVPATPLETSGASLGQEDLATLREEPRILGLAEMMNYPGVLAGDPKVIEKLWLFKGRVIDGHAPSLLGHDLQAYCSAGVQSDHETSDLQEAAEKLRAGMMIMIREGTSAKNLEALLPLVSQKNSRRFCFVTDDLHPEDLLERGHLDHVLRKAVRLGLDPLTALQMVTLNPAEFFGLHDRGAVAPGYRADLLVMENLESFSAERVYKDGRLAACDGRMVVFPQKKEESLPSWPIKIFSLSPESFKIRNKAPEPGHQVIGADSYQGQDRRSPLPKGGSCRISERYSHARGGGKAQGHRKHRARPRSRLWAEKRRPGFVGGSRFTQHHCRRRGGSRSVRRR